MPPETQQASAPPQQQQTIVYAPNPQQSPPAPLDASGKDATAGAGGKGAALFVQDSFWNHKF